MRRKDEEAGFSLKVNIPKIELNIDLPRMPLIDLPKIDLKEVILGQLTPIQDFNGADVDNRSTLAVLPDETWLLVFFHLKPRDIVAMMFSCKFFGELTNTRDIRGKLGEAKTASEHMKKLVGLLPQSSFTELSFFRSVNLPQVNFPMIEQPLVQTEELFQPGEQGFTMKQG